MDKTVKRSVSDYLAVSRGREHFASDGDYEQAEEKSWSVLTDALAGHGQEVSLFSEEEALRRKLVTERI